MALPSNVGTGTVIGRFIDSLGNPLTGSVVFTPTPVRLLNTTADPTPVTILPDSVTAQLNPSDGSFSVTLIATDDPDNNPSNWTYRVSFKFGGKSINGFSIVVPEGETVDLTTVTPVSASGGTYSGGGGSGSGGVTDHGQLTGLLDDDHPQYLTTGRADNRYIRTVNNTGPDANGNVTVSGGGSGGVTDHGALTGLGDDDHPQYALTDGSRGNFAATNHNHDARYYTQTEVDGLIENAGTPEDVVTSTTIDQIVTITQEEYDLLSTPRPSNILYAIVG